jgi:hypothetical protein
VDDLLQAARVDVFVRVLVDVLTDVAFEDAVVDVFVGITVDVFGIVFVEVVIDDLIDVSFGSVLLEFPVMILGLVGVILIGVLEGKPNKIKKTETFLRLLLIIYFQTEIKKIKKKNIAASSALIYLLSSRNYFYSR